MMLKTQLLGDGPMVLIAHGLFGSARNWGRISKALSEDRRVATVDMRNHGDSPWHAQHDYTAMADDLAEVVEGEGAPVDVVGHSMGGKAAMVLALTRPDLVRRLVVVDIAPVTYTHTQAPYVEAMLQLDLTTVQRRADADKALAETVPERDIRAFLLQSLDLTETPRWKLNLTALAQEMPKIMTFPELSGRFDGPVVFVRGGKSDYVTDDGMAAAQRLFPNATLTTVEGAGHWVHAEAPEAFLETLRATLD